MVTNNNEGFRYEDIIVSSVTDELDNGKPYKLVRDMAEQSWKVKSGKENALQRKWDKLKYGAALRLTIGKYNGWDYVADIEPLTELIAIESARKIQMAMRDLKNESIEAQVANKIIAEELSSGNVKVPEDIVDSHWNWIRHANKNYAPKESE